MSTTQPQNLTPSVIDDLCRLTLVDGLAMQSEGRTIRYKTVRLCETTVGDERAAQRLSERVMLVAGSYKLLASDADFRYAMTMMHIAEFECDGVKIPKGVIDLGMLDKLSPHDLGLIEQRVFLLEMAAEVRYGNLSEAQFEAALSAQGVSAAAAPQRSGQTAGVGSDDLAAQSGPVMLADYAGIAADSPPARNGR